MFRHRALLLEAVGIAALVGWTGWLWQDAAAAGESVRAQLAALEAPDLRWSVAARPAAAPSSSAPRPASATPAEVARLVAALEAGAADLRARLDAVAAGLAATDPDSAPAADLEPEVARLEESLSVLQGAAPPDPAREQAVAETVREVSAEQRARMFRAFLPNLVRQTLADLDKKLDLSPDQEKAVREVVTGFFAELARVYSTAFEGQFRSDAENSRIWRDLEDRFEEQMQPLLTPEQFAIYRADKAARRAGGGRK